MKRSDPDAADLPRPVRARGGAAGGEPGAARPRRSGRRAAPQARATRPRCSRRPSSPRCRRRRSAPSASRSSPNMARCAALERIEAGSPQSGVIHVGLERAVVHMQIVDRAAGAEPDRRPAHHRRRHARRQPRGDHRRDPRLARPDSRSPSRASATARRQMLASLEPERPLAIGSAFKLFILAELNRQIAAGQRHWSDVVDARPPLDPRRATCRTGRRDRRSPCTRLAALMISVSDNTRRRHAAPHRSAARMSSG